MKEQIRCYRKGLIKTYLKELKPYTHASGWVRNLKSDDKIKIYVPPICMKGNTDTGASYTEMKLEKGYLLKTILAFTDEGVILEAHGGGTSSLAFKDMPVEDLELLLETFRRVKEE